MAQTQIPAWRVQLVPWLVAVVAITLNLAARLSDTPLNRLFEENLCRLYHGTEPRDGIPERLCKVNKIQQELAFYIGLITTLELVGGKLAAHKRCLSELSYKRMTLS
jgi:hypothetical protein